MADAAVPEQFHDYLGLARRGFRGIRLVLLHGESGSGKSTALQWLLRNHPEFVDRGWRVVDEVRVPADMARVWRALRAGERVLVATHVRPRWYAPLRFYGRQAWFDLDAHPAKITHWLAQRGVRASAVAVAEFCRRYGPNYVDARLVLEHTGGMDFDLALARFRRDCRLQRGVLPRGLA